MALDMSGNNVSQAADPAKRLMRRRRSARRHAGRRGDAGKRERAAGRCPGPGAGGTCDRVARSAAFRCFRHGRLCRRARRYARHVAIDRRIRRRPRLCRTCEPGTAVRISTGAAVPEGADSGRHPGRVRREGDRVEVPATAPDCNIRVPRGWISCAASAADAGRILDGVALVAGRCGGAGKVPVAARPRVAILSSGDELAAPGTTPGPWQIFDSATYGMAGLVASWGGAAHRLAVAKDDVAAIARAAEEGLARQRPAGGGRRRIGGRP